jgi:hypothetical protein
MTSLMNAHLELDKPCITESVHLRFFSSRLGHFYTKSVSLLLSEAFSDALS